MSIEPRGAGDAMEKGAQLTVVIRVPPRQTDRLSQPEQRATPRIVVARKTFVGDETVQSGVYALHRESSTKANCLSSLYAWVSHILVLCHLACETLKMTTQLRDGFS